MPETERCRFHFAQDHSLLTLTTPVSLVLASSNRRVSSYYPQGRSVVIDIHRVVSIFIILSRPLTVAVENSRFL